MDQKTVTIDVEHTEAEAVAQAKVALDELAKQGATFLPIDPIENAGAFSEILTDKGRLFRYTRQFDMNSGVVHGRIDIRYEKQGASG